MDTIDRRDFSRDVSRSSARIALLCLTVACTGVRTAPTLDVPDDSAAHDIAGEWVDVAKTTPNDSSIWVLANGGDDQSMRLERDNANRWHESRHHYGRWRVVHGDDADKLCVVRRPGRDALSCVRYRLDTVVVDGTHRRHLLLLGYAGEHHTTDRSLVERLRLTGTSPATLEGSAISGGGGFHPRAVQPERPSVATHAGTVAPGFLEIESGGERDKTSGADATYSVPTVVKIGVSNRTQLALQLPVSGGGGSSVGAGDVALGLKVRVTEDRPLLQDVALLPQVKFATGGAHGTGTTDVSVLLINSRTLGPVGLDLNVGMTLHSGREETVPRTSSMWAAALGIPVHGPLGWALEMYGYPGTSGRAGYAPVIALLAGPTFVVRQELALDAGLIVPIEGAQPHALYAGVVVNAGKLFTLSPSAPIR